MVQGNQGWSTATGGVTAEGLPDQRYLQNTVLQWKDAFLADYRQSGIISRACKAAGISRSTYVRAMEALPEFKEEVLDAKEEAIERLEDIARKRAMRQSDNLMMFLLRAARPEVYRENFKHQLSANIEATITDEERLNVLRALLTNPATNNAVHALMGIALGNPGGAGYPAIAGALGPGQAFALPQPGVDGRSLDGEPVPDRGDATPAREE